MSHRTNHEDKHRDYARHRSTSKYSSRTPAFPHEKQPKPHATIHLNHEEQHSATTLATSSPPKGILVSPRSVHSDYPRPVLEAMPEKEPTETDYSELAMKALTHDWIRSSQYTKTCHEYHYSSMAVANYTQRYEKESHMFCDLGYISSMLDNQQFEDVDEYLQKFMEPGKHVQVDAIFWAVRYEKYLQKILNSQLPVYATRTPIPFRNEQDRQRELARVEQLNRDQELQRIADREAAAEAQAEALNVYIYELSPLQVDPHLKEDAQNMLTSTRPRVVSFPDKRQLEAFSSIIRRLREFLHCGNPIKRKNSLVKLLVEEQILHIKP